MIAMAVGGDVESLARISVFIALSDSLLAERMALLLAGEGFDIVADDRLADVVVADHAGPSAGLAVVIADGIRNTRGETALTARESEVLSLLAEGSSNKSIARALDISVHTAKFHVASLLAKLGARNRSDAVAIGMRRGLVLL